MELQYCIDCEKLVDFEKEGFHIFTSRADIGILELSLCDGPFATCPPPEYDLDYWEWLFLQEPDEEWIKATNDSKS